MERIDKMSGENGVLLRGILLDAPEESHVSHGKAFLRMCLSVQRLSGAFDHLYVVAEKALFDTLDPAQGPMLEVEGQIRSYNNRSGQGRKLMISVFAQEMRYCQGLPDNQVTLLGEICREPVYRHTPLGREITDIMLSVPRKYQRRDYVPCILWGSVARMGAECEKGDFLRISGRLQSRSYVKQTGEGPEERVAFEVSAITAEKAED